LNVDVLRVSPQSRHTGLVIKAFRAALDGDPPATLDKFMPFGACDGYWRGAEGMALPLGQLRASI
jgi:hypothetical protein